MTTADMDALLTSMWARFAGVAQERVDVLDRYLAALKAGEDCPALRADAASAAHKLAGALGTYGRGGSDEAARLQDVLQAGGDRTEVAGLVDVVRRAVLA